jgi:hypothetical protein
LRIDHDLGLSLDSCNLAFEPFVRRLGDGEASFAQAHGFLSDGADGGFCPLFSTLTERVSVADPVGVVILVCSVVPVVSLQPVIPMPPPARASPNTVALISFRMIDTSSMESAAASDLT